MEGEFSLSSDMEDRIVGEVAFQGDVVEECQRCTDFTADGILSGAFEVVGTKSGVELHEREFFHVDSGFCSKAFHGEVFHDVKTHQIAGKVAKLRAVKIAAFRPQWKVTRNAKIPDFAERLKAERVLVVLLAGGFAIVVVGVEAVDERGADIAQTYSCVGCDPSIIKDVQTRIEEGNKSVRKGWGWRDEEIDRGVALVVADSFTFDVAGGGSIRGRGGAARGSRFWGGIEGKSKKGREEEGGFFHGWA